MKSSIFCGIVFTGLVAALVASVYGLRCQADDPTVSAEPAPPSQKELEEQYRVQEERMAALQLVHLKIFRDEFEAAKTLTVRERLVRAANVTGEMEALAEKQNSKEGSSRYAIFPRASHVARVIAARPWIRDDPSCRHLDLTFVRATGEYRWPTMADQEELRQLLDDDDDSDVQAMAIEALATLYDPSDLNEIADARYSIDISDESSILFPSLFFHSRYDTGGQQGQQGEGPPREMWPTEEDPLLDASYWRPLTLGQYVDRALRQLTGADVSRANVEEWRNKHGDSKESLWYWEYRLRRESDPIEWKKDELAVWQQQRLAELAELDPLTEAKVLLLHRKHRDQGSPDAGFLGTWQTRLMKEELFQILAGDRLWDDVEWTDQRGETYELDSQLATRIMLNADVNFGREDVPRLIETLKTTKLSLTGYGRNAWHVGISRLLPAAEPESIDDIETRDGYLRNAIQNGAGAIELVRVGLPINQKFLHELFFQKRKQYIIKYDPLQWSIMEELGGTPRSAEQRQLLWALVIDDRFRPNWTYVCKPGTGKGDVDDVLRRIATRSINKHAGEDFITDSELQKLGEAETNQATFELILARLKAFEAVPMKPADKP